RAIPAQENVPNEDDHTHFMALDFGVCINDKGDLEPQLIEMQGFPSLFAFQAFYPAVFEKYFERPEGFDYFLSGYTKDSYVALLKDIIIADANPENVILLEIEPHKQKTRIDFKATKDFTGIEIVCLTALIAEGDKLFYLREGIKTQVKRIYNRIIFDELNQKKASLDNIIDITKPYDVTWVSHPNWFYRISKFTLPFIKHQYVPETFFLNELKVLPTDLNNYVLKPLFSFAGQGVIIDITQQDIDVVKDPENWILQKKVKYADIIETPDIAAKAEIRIFYFWKDGWARPQAVCNLARLSKGKMIGVRYNMDKKWVGGNFAYFEK
ncbi:MAG: hypothetical protein ABIR81_07530, partial [Ginsengibacter sp.]